MDQGTVYAETAISMAQDTKRRDLIAGTTPPGRVARDRAGQTVWQWTEEESRDSTSVLLKFLDNDALSLEPTQAVPVPADAAPRVTGGQATESTSVTLARLDDGQLSLEPTWTAPVPERLRRRSGVERTDDDTGTQLSVDGEALGGGFNPYDHS